MNDRKHQYPVVSNEYHDNLARSAKRSRRTLDFLLAALLVAAIALGFIAGYAVKADAAVVKQANCWHTDVINDLMTVEQGEDIHITVGGTPRYTLQEQWCRTNGFTAEVITANTPEEIEGLTRWWKQNRYENPYLLCVRDTKAWTITDLEDYAWKKTRTKSQKENYSAWALTYAERHGCMVRR